MIRCSMILIGSQRCPNPTDVQLRVDRCLHGVECSFVIACCVDSECARRYAATVREFQRGGARVTETKLPYAAVVALKHELKS
jgi:hypothetical protein